MDIILKGQEAEDYADYREAIAVAKTDPNGQVVGKIDYQRVVGDLGANKLLLIAAQNTIEELEETTSRMTASETFEHHFVGKEIPLGAVSEYPTGVIRPQGDYRHEWTQGDINTIQYCLRDATPKSHKTLEYLAGRLDPRLTDLAIRSKLTRMGIRVIKGELVWRQD